LDVAVDGVRTVDIGGDASTSAVVDAVSARVATRCTDASRPARPVT
jgi:hypothetical protein